MSDTTTKNIEAIAPELKDFINDSCNKDLVELILEDVTAQIREAVYGTKEERAQRYLAAHLLTLIKQGSDGVNSGASGPIEKEKVGDVEVTYSTSVLSKLSDVNRYDETKYGRVYMIIRKGCVLAFKVFTP